MDSITLNTMGDLERLVPNEETAAKYLSFVRWGEWPNCPFCHNPKAYIIEKGRRYKCANPSCHKKFSVTTNSLMHGTNLSLSKWLSACFTHARKIGRAYSWDIENAIGCTSSTSWYVVERLRFCWKYVNRENESRQSMFEQLLKQLFEQGDRWEEFNKIRYGNHHWHVSDIDNIGDPRQYDRLVRYAEMRMIHCEWIFLNFASGEEVISETLLHLVENGIKEYNADSIVNLINRTIQRMWQLWVDAHPNISRRYRDRAVQRKRDSRLNLSDYYIAGLMKQAKANKDTPSSEIRQNKAAIQEYRKRLKKRRDNLHQIYDWHSHFD